MRRTSKLFLSLVTFGALLSKHCPCRGIRVGLQIASRSDSDPGGAAEFVAARGPRPEDRVADFGPFAGAFRAETGHSTEPVGVGWGVRGQTSAGGPCTR